LTINQSLINIKQEDKKMKKIVVTSHIPETLYEEIRKQAFEDRVSIAEFIRQACEAKISLKVQGEENESITDTDS
jgi:hypothetical protein